MTRFRTHARDVTDKELVEMLHGIFATLVDAAYLMLDQAIAFAVERTFTNTKPPPEHIRTSRGASPEELYERQRELPRLDVEVDETWVQWVIAAHGNWLWMMYRFDGLSDCYEKRTKKEAPFRLEMRRLGANSPRPRAPGRTPFPQESC